VNDPVWPRVKAVFTEALERPAGQRSSFVAEACGGDHALRQEVESLLRAHESAGEFAWNDALAAMSIAELRDFSQFDPELQPGTRIGGAYDLVGLIGSGSMGRIYKALDCNLGRPVALKVLAPSLVPDAAARVRFEREARIIASLSHPNICALYHVGRHGPFDFLVMEFLEGETLAACLRRGPLPLPLARR
jgi:serine/threonine protein kinase